MPSQGFSSEGNPAGRPTYRLICKVINPTRCLFKVLAYFCRNLIISQVISALDGYDALTDALSLKAFLKFGLRLTWPHDQNGGGIPKVSDDFIVEFILLILDVSVVGVLAAAA